MLQICKKKTTKGQNISNDDLFHIHIFSCGINIIVIYFVYLLIIFIVNEPIVFLRYPLASVKTIYNIKVNIKTIHLTVK